MNKQQLYRTMEKAQDICTRSGGRFTDKRKAVLRQLLMSNRPLSAYEISNAYNRATEKPMPTMSVYRILDFLETKDLVHKLSSTSKYVACSYISCDHEHEVSQFLICGNCQSAKEITISARIIDELDNLMGKAGFALTNSQLELRCLCNDCLASTA